MILCQCDRAKPCDSCCKRRITDECRYDDAHNDGARAHAVVRKELQDRIDALEEENAEQRNKDTEQKHKIAELIEANNRAADVFCQTNGVMAANSDPLTPPLNTLPMGSPPSLPLRTRDRPVSRRTRRPAPWRNPIQSSDISRCMVQNEVSLKS
jgi:hypothetical protein